MICSKSGLTNVDDDTNSHMSDTLVQLSASANVSSDNSALVTFPQAEGCLMRNALSLHPIPSRTGSNLW